MKAIAVIPGRKDSIHLRDVPEPRVADIPDERGVLVRILRVGVDGTDREINNAEYGAAPEGDSHLVLGHESFGRVEAVGRNVREVGPGDYVALTVRRPGNSIYDRIGAYDMTTDDNYRERGIKGLHGFLTELVADEPEYIVRVPAALKDVAVLIEPASIVEKAVQQAFEIQRRLRVWRPQRGAVLGVGALGLLAAALLRLRGLDVTSFGLKRAPFPNSELAGDIGARYVSTRESSPAEASRKFGPFDIIVEGTGHSPLVFEAMDVLAKNGVLVMLSITGGGLKTEIPADRINQGFVLGNKVAVGSVNSNRQHFESVIGELCRSEIQFPGWLSKLLTHPIQGLHNYRKMIDTLNEAEDAIKVFVEVAPL